MILILIFAEVLGTYNDQPIPIHLFRQAAKFKLIGLYGLIVALLMNAKASQGVTC